MEALHNGNGNAQAEPVEGRLVGTVIDITGSSPGPPDSDPRNTEEAAPAGGDTAAIGELLQGDAADMAIMGLAAQRRRPANGWHRETGVHAPHIRRFARTKEMQRFSLSALSFDAISPRMLHAVYRQKLMQQLRETTELASLNTIGRLLEKIPAQDDKADDNAATSDARQLEDCLRRSELLLERLRDSRTLLDSTDPVQPVTDTPRPDVVHAVAHAPAGRECS